MKKLKEFLKRNEGMIIFTLTVMLGCYFATTYLLLNYILENNIHVVN
jgi:hypothetical protein